MRFCLIAQLVGSTEVVEDECDNTARIKLLSVISVRSLFCALSSWFTDINWKERLVSFPLSFLLSPFRLWYSLGARRLRHWRGASSKNLTCSLAFKASHAQLPAWLSLPCAQRFFNIENLLWLSLGAMLFLALLILCSSPGMSLSEVHWLTGLP